MLGESSTLWSNLQQSIVAKFSPVTVEWGYASKTTGWGLRLKHEKRAVVYMTPCKGYFLASFALGEKAITQIHEAELPEAILTVIDSAPKYAEGRGVRIEVRTAADVRSIEKIAEIKMRS